VQYSAIIFQSRTRLTQKNAELEELLQDYEARIEEEDDRYQQVSGDKKKLNQTIQDLEEQYVHFIVL
jgi:myosin protein heavy chain